MLDTAFNTGLELSKTRSEARAESQMKAWSYVGRFIWGFAMIENQVNQLFLELIGGGGWANQTGGVGLNAGLWLTHTLDLRKKLDVIERIYESRGIDESKTFKRVHELHNLRNPIVHFPWEEDLDARLSCDYIDKHGHCGFSKPGKSEGQSITYSEFDSYDRVASEIYDKLYKLWESAIPITEDELRYNIEVAISSSDNVLRFPSKPQIDDED
jgi:hypothetical protein